MLAWRLLSAAIGIPIVLALVVAGGPAYAATLALVAGLAVAEVLVQTGMPARGPRVWSAGLTTGAMVLLATQSFLIQAIVLPGLFGLTLALWLAGRDVERPARWWLGLALALYVGGLARYLLLLRQGPDGRAWVLFALFGSFASDTGAYAVGRLLGRHRLAPTISPGKTIEGAAGGLVAAGLAAMLLGFALGLRLPAPVLLSLGLGLSVAAQAGDLFESALKRRLQIKDAGSLVPGHGGLLDRLDSLLFSGAMVYCVVRWISL